MVEKIADITFTTVTLFHSHDDPRRTINLRWTWADGSIHR